MATYRIVRVPDADQDDIAPVAGPYPADTEDDAGRIGGDLMRRLTVVPSTDYRLQAQAENGTWTDVGLMRTAWTGSSAAE